jgi:hypothetical protein
MPFSLDSTLETRLLTPFFWKDKSKKTRGSSRRESRAIGRLRKKMKGSQQGSPLVKEVQPHLSTD